MKHNKGFRNTRFLVELAVLIALELLLELTGLGYFHTAILEFTIMQVPVIVGAIVLGPMAGLTLGTVFGLTSFWQCFGKSQFGAMLLSINPFGTLVVCLLPRMLMGLLCGLLFCWLQRMQTTAKARTSLCCGISGLSGALLNTILFMGFLVAIFGRSEFLLGLGSEHVVPFILSMVGIQGVIEAVICCVIGASVSYALLRARQQPARTQEMEAEVNMKRSVITLVIVVVLTAALLFAALCGVGSVIPRTQDGIVLGLDLVGGSEITYEAVVPAGTENVEEGMASAVTMLRQRLDALGYTEANAYQSGDRQIVVEIPAVSDPEEAVQKLGSTAVVTFQDADKKVWIDGNDIDKAYYEYSATDETGIARHHVVLTFTSSGRAKFVEATKSVASRTGGDNYLSIYLDKDEISTPQVGSEYATTGIDSDSAFITLGNNATAEEATYLANLISAGQMPFSLECVMLQGVGASLGERSLQTSLLAGLIGIIIVMLFMMVVYRVMGVISCIALTLYGALMAVLLSVFHLNLSLPGIAGIILTVGMAVDANVIIYERIKEELRTGKTLRYAIDTGYKGALRAIVDSNITTIIAGVVLWVFGTGTIIGFAQTLLIGVILSMIIMLVVTKQLLHAAVGLKIRSPKAYCV